MLFDKNDIRNPSGVSGYRLDKAVNKMKENNKLDGLGVYFQKAEEKYNINSIILFSIAILESGYGLSELSMKKNNLFGLDADDRYKGTEKYGGKYNSKEDSIEAAAFRISKQYLEIDVSCPWRYLMGKKDLNSVGEKWCPNKNKEEKNEENVWAKKVNRIAENINDILDLEIENSNKDEIWNEIEKILIDLKDTTKQMNKKIDSSYNILKDFF